MTTHPITLSMTLQSQLDAKLLCPAGLSTPHVSCIGFQWRGADSEVVWDPTSAQSAILLTPRADEIALNWCFDLGGCAYPEVMFAARNSRFTRAADALIGEARAIVDSAVDPVKALADHVANQFTYGHPDTRFYDGMDEIPQLCALTVGSCVDINAYFIAACRSAGIEAGYVTGCFVPEEKRSHCNDMHCWVVTRYNEQILEWDIAHHLKMGTTDIQPGLNPKPGVRVPLAHSMGLNFPTLGIKDLKLIGESMWVAGDRILDAEPQITLQGYEDLAQARI